jgi:Fic family protein
MKLNLPVSPEFSKTLGRLDRMQARWSSQKLITDDRLAELAATACTESVGASCRLAGIRATDDEIAMLLDGKTENLRQGRELRGYAAALQQRLPGNDRLLDAGQIRKLHALMLGSEGMQPSPWRAQVLYREGFDAKGRATGHVFTTLPVRLIDEKMEQLLTWLELELRGGDQHPVLVVGTFLLGLLCVSPFEKGNGRIVRLLAGHLLQRAGYDSIPYSSIERQMEQRREIYHDATAQAQKRIWTSESDPTPWLEYFLQVLDGHRESIEIAIARERPVDEYPPLQRRILETVREHGNVDAALLIQSTGANRNTLKDNLRRLVNGGVLEKTGERRGTRYRLSSGTRLNPALGEALEH